MKKIITLVFAFFLTANIISQSAFAQATFSAKTDFTAGSGAWTVAAGDLNGDGKSDLAATNTGTTTISVIFNTTVTGASTPTFSAKTDFAVGFAPRFVSIGDINGDGKPDLVVANLNSNSVSILLSTTSPGASTPTFSAKTDFTVGTTPQSVTIGDLNGDGKPDLAAANNGANTISVLLNTTPPGNATPTFSAKVDFAAGTGTAIVSIGDLNGDGKPDLATANNSANSVSVLLNTTPTGDATPTFSAKTDFTAGSGTRTVSIGDLNGDGKPDLATSNSLNSASVLLNTTATGASTPTFSAKTDFTAGSAPRFGSLADVNNDGKPDLIIVNGSGASVSVLLNTTTPGASTPTFTTKADFTTASSPRSVAISDFNGDGEPDMVTANNAADNVSVLLNTMALGVTPASFSAKTDFTAASNSRSVSIADFNGDGKPDLVTANFNGTSVSVFLNTTTPGASTPTFSAKTDFTTGSSPQSVATGDFNGDGKPDLAVPNYNATSVSVFLNTTTPGASTPTFSAKTDFTTGSQPRAVYICDLNGDGKPDLAVTNFTSNNVSVFLNTTTPGASTPTFSAKTDFTTGTGPLSVSIGDLNGDGKPDLSVVNNGSTSISVFLNTTTPGAATPTFSAKTDFTTGTGPNLTSIGDLNGDGKPDLAVANLSGNNVSVFLNTTTPGASTPTFSSKTDFTTGTGAISVSIGDLNGDGKPDLATANSVTGINSVSVLLNTTTPGASTPTFSANTDLTTGSRPFSVLIGDFNGDGKPDLAAANNTGNTVSVLMNTAIFPLPVELASFTSSVNSNNVTLNWSTVQEENNKGFEVERNSFGAGWKKVGYVEGHGTTNTTQNYNFKDNGLTTGRYSYRLKQKDYNGNFEYFELSSEVIIGVPAKYALAQNYPNPFNPSTVLGFQLPVAGFVTLKIFDISGREVSSLVNEVKEAGYYSVTFDAKNLSSGIYFYKLSTDKFSDVKKMVVVK